MKMQGCPEAVPEVEINRQLTQVPRMGKQDLGALCNDASYGSVRRGSTYALTYLVVDVGGCRKKRGVTERRMEGFLRSIPFRHPGERDRGQQLLAGSISMFNADRGDDESCGPRGRTRRLQDSV